MPKPPNLKKRRKELGTRASRRQAVEALSAADASAGDEVATWLTPELRSPPYRAPTPDRLVSLKEEVALAETIETAAAIAEVLGAHRTKACEERLLELWGEHPASLVRRQAGLALLRHRSPAALEALRRAFATDFADPLDPYLLDGALFCDVDSPESRDALTRAREELWTLAALAELTRPPAAAYEALSSYFSPEVLDQTKGIELERARAILRALLAQLGYGPEGPKVRPFLEEALPVQGIDPALDPRWWSLCRELLRQPKLAELGARLLAAAGDPEADRVLIERLRAGKERPLLACAVRAAADRRPPEALPILVELLSGPIDTGDARAILEALEAFEGREVLPRLRDVLASPGLHWFAQEELPALIQRLEHPAPAQAGAPAGRSEPETRAPLPPPPEPTEAVAREIEDAWQRIEAWLEKHAPHLAGGLAPPAGEEAIERAEEALGMRFPADFRASLRLHDGEAIDIGLIYGLHLNRLGELLQDWKVMEDLRQSGVFAGEENDPPEGLRPGHWNRGWVPVATSGGGDSFSMDLDPPQRGRPGQMFFFDHEVGPGPVEAASFAAWLRAYASSLEAGHVRVDEEGGLEPIA